MCLGVVFFFFLFLEFIYNFYQIWESISPLSLQTLFSVPLHHNPLQTPNNVCLRPLRVVPQLTGALFLFRENVFFSMCFVW